VSRIELFYLKQLLIKDVFWYNKYTMQEHEKHNPEEEEAKEDTLLNETTLKEAQSMNSETPIDTRIEIVKKLLPKERKEQMLKISSVDSSGRPVRYYRTMKYEELNDLLTKGIIKPEENPDVISRFETNKRHILNALKKYINEREKLAYVSKELNELGNNPSFEEFLRFLHTKIPRFDLFNLQKTILGGYYGGSTGLTSVSVGAPTMEPSQKLVVVEMAIPDENVLVNSLRENAHPESSNDPEKEVNTKYLNRNWIMDAYLSEDDFVNRCIQDDTSPTHRYYGKDTDHSGRPRSSYGMFDTLQDWAHAESIKSVLPEGKIKEIEDELLMQRPLS